MRRGAGVVTVRAVRYGSLGRRDTRRGTRHAPDGEFVGVWGRDPDKATSPGHRYGVPAYADVDALIATVDAVAVALPPRRAGRHRPRGRPRRPAPAARQTARAHPRRRRPGGEVDARAGWRRWSSSPTGSTPTSPASSRHRRARWWCAARATLYASIFAPGDPYGASAWRREHGGLWDIGPHALSIIVPVLGRATGSPRWTARGITPPAAGHTTGATSTLSLTLDAAPAARAFDFVFYGDNGVESVPRGDGTALQALSLAVDQLVEQVDSGARDHQCDVRFGREVVAVLDAAESARRQGRTVRLPG